jgi:hypothetical protein
MKQLDLFQWADSRPLAEVIDLVPAIIRHICAQPYPNPIKNGDIVQLPVKKKVA